MTKRTTLNRLKRLRQMLEAERRRESWYTNPKSHPLPTLPRLEYLEGSYLDSVRMSCPELAEKASELVAYVRKERGG